MRATPSSSWRIGPVSRSAGLTFTVDPETSAAQYRTHSDELAAGEVTVKSLRDGAGAQVRRPLAGVEGWAATLRGDQGA